MRNRLCFPLLLLLLMGSFYAPLSSAKISYDDRANELLQQMTLEEKVAQMLQAERAAVTPAELQTYPLGSILSGGGSAPSTGNNATEWKQMVADYQNGISKSRLGIPVIYGVDAIHGHNNLGGATVLPHNIALGAANNPELMRALARITAEEMLETGVTWNFAPCVAVAKDARWGRYYESYSTDPQLVTRLSIPFIQTLQSEYGLAATLKHFVADGAAEWGTGDSHYMLDQGNANISDHELRSIHLLPYRMAMPLNPYTVMTSFSSIRGVKNHHNRYLIQEVLKKELGFWGFVISDWEGIRQIPASDYRAKIIEGINAGIDMLMEPFSWREVHGHILSAVASGEIPMSRIDDAVRRILRVKFAMDLFNFPMGQPIPFSARMTPAERQQIAKQAVRESLVLLKNQNRALPLRPHSRVFVTGPAANNLALQSGGWTLSWQGEMSQSPLLKGRTILDGFTQMARQTGGSIITDYQVAKESADAVVVVLGEQPYAEGKGDDGFLGLTNGLALEANLEALNMAESLRAERKIPVIAVMVFGRPRLLGQWPSQWDAAVMAWLPGTQGDGVAEVLYGQSNFTGKLPVPWPQELGAYPLELPLSSPRQTLYPFGYGLQLEKKWHE